MLITSSRPRIICIDLLLVMRLRCVYVCIYYRVYCLMFALILFTFWGVSLIMIHACTHLRVETEVCILPEVRVHIYMHICMYVWCVLNMRSYLRVILMCICAFLYLSVYAHTHIYARIHAISNCSFTLWCMRVYVCLYHPHRNMRESTCRSFTWETRACMSCILTQYLFAYIHAYVHALHV